MKNCPICNNNFVISKIEKNIVKKCVKHPGHFISLYIKNNTLNKVKLSFLPYDYSVLIDYDNSKTEIKLYGYSNSRSYLNNKNVKTIEIPKIISPDYPDLTFFKETINKYIIFI